MLSPRPINMTHEETQVQQQKLRISAGSVCRKGAHVETVWNQSGVKFVLLLDQFGVTSVSGEGLTGVTSGTDRGQDDVTSG